MSLSIAHPSEKGGYNAKMHVNVEVGSIAHPSEKGGYNNKAI